MKRASSVFILKSKFSYGRMFAIYQKTAFFFWIFMACLLSLPLVSANSSTIDFPGSSSLYWSNANSPTIQTHNFSRNRLARVILITKAYSKLYGRSLAFAFGFYCDRARYDGCLLAVMILEVGRGLVPVDKSPQVVWMANRNHLVKENATLHARSDKGLVLMDSNGVQVWSTNITLFSVSGMALRGTGDLVFFNSSKSKIWRSFNFPTNTLLMEQELRGKRKLISSTSHTNFRTGKFYLTITNSSLTAFVNYKKPVAYTRLPLEVHNYSRLLKVKFKQTSFSFIYKEREEKILVQESSIQLLKLDPDGGPRVYIWQPGSGWGGLAYSLGSFDECQKPLVCGRYGVCLRGECSCPLASNGMVYFTPQYTQSPARGCRFTDALSSNSTKYKDRLVSFGNLSYFSYFDPTAAVAGLTELEPCKLTCELNSSCKAAFFKYGSNASNGLCYLHAEVLSIRHEQYGWFQYGSVAFLKVPIPIPPHDSSASFSQFGKVSAIVISAGMCAAILGVIVWRIRRLKCRGKDCFDHFFGLPVRFSYKELASATGSFSTQLGRGGYGTVYKGELKNGAVIAVKRLDCIEQHMKEFVAEMKTLGSIHHIHLVKLIGYCAEESNRMLVYQYMSNGSLDKWIFQDDRRTALNWETRRRILLDVAKGLAYLHEECSQRIAHLDVKPHNILLDENFNAKISDFGLARFIDRNHSHVVTGIKGTFGYLAPEWQHSKITVKADIYSFGIVVLETVSGRMVLDYSRERSDVYLLAILQRMARDDRVIDIIDKKIPDWESHRDDLLKMIDVAVWCLNDDLHKRPSMTSVVKTLDGTMELDHSLEFKFDNVLVFSGASTDSSSSGSSLN